MANQIFPWPSRPPSSLLVLKSFPPKILAKDWQGESDHTGVVVLYSHTAASSCDDAAPSSPGGGCGVCECSCVRVDWSGLVCWGTTWGFHVPLHSLWRLGGGFMTFVNTIPRTPPQFISLPHALALCPLVSGFLRCRISCAMGDVFCNFVASNTTPPFWSHRSSKRRGTTSLGSCASAVRAVFFAPSIKDRTVCFTMLAKQTAPQQIRTTPPSFKSHG